MQRRRFLTASVSLVTAGGIGSASEGRPSKVGRRQTLELRRYTFASPDRMQAFERFATAGWVPALNRAGIRPVGVFRMLKADNPQAGFAGETSLELFVLLPHENFGSVAGLEAKMVEHPEYRAALARLGDSPKQPAYLRYESSLLTSFEKWPRVVPPAKNPSRLLQMRTYESATAERGRMKVRMFNDGSLIEVIREVGIAPVFFGQAFAGPQLPCLTYMVAFDSIQAMNAGWGRFAQHPGWQRLSQDPEFQDTVSHITNRLLRPVDGSQI